MVLPNLAHPGPRAALPGPLPGSITRRGFVLGVAAGLATAGCAAAPRLGALSPAAASTRWLLSGYFDHRRRAFSVGVVDLERRTRTSLVVGHRGHGVCLHPTRPGHALLFAQRPGTVSTEFDFVNGKLIREFRTDSLRHFYGHGLGLPEMETVLCTENNYSDGFGIVAVRNAETLAVEREFETHGLGPHDMRLLDGGATVAVANAGTHSNPDGKKDWIDPTKPPLASLSLVDAASGVLKDQIEFPNMLLKHLHATRSGILGMALRGPNDSLVAVRHPDGRIVRAQDPGQLFAEMRFHTLSIRVCERTRTVGVTTPIGHVVAFWDIDTGAFKTIHPMAGATGLEITHDDRQFVVTSIGRGRIDGLTPADVEFRPGDGTLTRIDSRTLEIVEPDLPEAPGVMWASHALAVAERDLG